MSYTRTIKQNNAFHYHCFQEANQIERIHTSLHEWNWEINNYYVNLKYLFSAGFNILVWYSYQVDVAMIQWSTSHDPACKNNFEQKKILCMFWLCTY